MSVLQPYLEALHRCELQRQQKQQRSGAAAAGAADDDDDIVVSCSSGTAAAATESGTGRKTPENESPKNSNGIGLL
ncbi:GD17428 [Drosophila simulans]|uniref:GD17428 n=1 Tax=Drosophila simulans TaxID=7240 RepID=B4R7B5_DROSI|nr:GD17428 [Drosophila simulans]